MPRDPERIAPFLKAVEDLWRRYPDMRFGQLVSNVLPSDPFYIEDDEALVLLQQVSW